MDRKNNIIGNQQAHGGREWIDIIEMALGEGYSSADPPATMEPVNLFGRPVSYRATDKLSFTSGMATSGLRCAAVLEGERLENNFGDIRDAVRRHLPVVLHNPSRHVRQGGYSDDPDRQAFYSVKGTGAIQMYCASVQEMVDFTLIAHKLAELALLPVILGMDIQTGTESSVAEVPTREDIRAFLGRPDDRIDTPTPAQEMIFGEKRRRIPNWFHFDLPVAGGAIKDEMALAYEMASHRRFGQDPVLALIDRVFTEYGELTGRKYSAVSGYRLSDARYVILAQGSAYGAACEAVDAIRQSRKTRVGCLNLPLLQPLPAGGLRDILQKCRGLTILEPLMAGSQDHSAIRNALTPVLSDHKGEAMSVYRALYGGSLDGGSASRAIENMLPKGENREEYYLGLEFTRPTSDFPKHQVLLQTIARLYPGIENESLVAARNGKDPLPDDAGGDSGSMTSALPEIIRRYKDLGPPYSNVSRFQDHTSIFYRDGKPDEMVADPFQSIPVAPASTSVLDRSLSRSELYPDLDAAKCTGCGLCFTWCPHSAIPPVVIGTEAVIRKGIEMVTAAGGQLRQITPLVKPWAKLAAREIEGTNGEEIDLGTVLPAAFRQLTGQAGMNEEKKESTSSEANAIVKAVSGMPFSVTDVFYSGPESEQKGSGELFSLALDPNSCTACGLCTVICPEDALVMKPLTGDAFGKITHTYELWEQFPDTSAESVERAVKKQGYDPIAAKLLQRNSYHALLGGQHSEKNAATRAALHTLAAAIASIGREGRDKQLEAVRKGIDELSSHVRSTLVDSMPVGELEEWSKVLEDTNLNRLSISELTTRLDEMAHLRPLETEPVRRKLGLLSEMTALEGLLREGPTGVGRSGFGLLLSGSEGLSWAAQYPANPFSQPVVFDWQGSPAERLLGLMQGHIRHWLDNIKLMRRASLEAAGKYDPRFHNAEIATLGWEDASEEERSWLPPVWLVGESSRLAEDEWGRILELLGSGLPLRICIFDNLVLPHGERTAARILQRQAALVSAISMKRAYICQSSMGFSGHLAHSLEQGMQFPGPALFVLFAADPERHVLAGDDWTGLANLAVNTRVFPLVSYRPSGEFESFISKDLSLEHNPLPGQTWTVRSIRYGTGEEKDELDYHPTVADWLFTLDTWREHFQLLQDDMEEPVGIAEYLDLEQGDRKGQVPVLTRADINGDLVRYRVTDEVLEICRLVRHNWDSLKELAGMLTPFPEKLKNRVKEELSEEYDARAAELQKEFEGAKQEFEQEHLEKMRTRLKEKLMALSRRKTEV